MVLLNFMYVNICRKKGHGPCLFICYLNFFLLRLKEFLACADTILGDAPARIVLVVGGPGSGKGLLASRLEAECNVVHLSSGDLLRDEVNRGTPLGRECATIMEQGGLVSSAVIVTLIRRHMRGHPGKRVLLDGFPRSPENARDLVELCGVPELALHLDCDDTIMLERIIGRGRKGKEAGDARADDNFDTALERLRTYHKHHNPTIQWLREQHVPIGKSYLTRKLGSFVSLLKFSDADLFMFGSQLGL